MSEICHLYSNHDDAKRRMQDERIGSSSQMRTRADRFNFAPLKDDGETSLISLGMDQAMNTSRTEASRTVCRILLSRS